MQQSMLRSSWPWPDPWNDVSSSVDKNNEVEWETAFSSRRDSMDRSVLAPETMGSNQFRRASVPSQSPFADSSMFASTNQQSLLSAFPPQQVLPPPSPQQQKHSIPLTSPSPIGQHSIPLTHQQSPYDHGGYPGPPPSSSIGQQAPIASMTRRDYHPLKRAPPVDMIEVGNKVQIIVELPGLKKENLKIDIHDKSHFLTLKGRYERDEYGEEVNFLMNERTHGKFRRRIRLPQYADIDNVQANLKDGLLIVEMPSLKKHDLYKKKRVVNVDGLHHQSFDHHYTSHDSGQQRRFEWAKDQNDRATDTTVHHHHK